MSLVTFVVLMVSVLSLVKSQPESDLNNAIFDSILVQTRISLAKKGNYTDVRIPDLFKEYKVGLFVQLLSASLSASQGRLSDLTSVRRVGDVIVTTHDSSAFFTAAVTLDTLRAVFGHYTLAFGFLQKSGDRLAVDVRNNKFDITLEVRQERHKCQMRLDKISVREFTDINVDLSGLSIFNSVGHEVANRVIEFFSDYIAEVARTYALEMANRVIKSRDLCHLIIENVLEDETVNPNHETGLLDILVSF